MSIDAVIIIVVTLLIVPAFTLVLIGLIYLTVGIKDFSLQGVRRFVCMVRGHRDSTYPGYRVGENVIVKPWTSCRNCGKEQAS